MITVPVNKPRLYPETFTVLQKVVQSGWISGEGLYVKEFEDKFSSYCNTKFGITTNSGTTALHLALLALGIGKGDEVILPATTIASCYFAIWYVGAKAIPVDVANDTYTINPNLIESAITEKTRAIMPVHLYGHPCDMGPILEIAKQHNLFIIEDAAEAHGAEYKGKKVGSIGDVGVFSFYANKIVTCGEGGIIVTNNKNVYERAQKLKNLAHSKKRRFIHDEVGYRYQMTNMQAALGLVSLSHIDESIKKKGEMVKIYNQLLRGVPGLTLPVEKPWAKSVYWMYTILINKRLFGKGRDEVANELSTLGIQTRTFFYSPQTMFKPLHMYKNVYTPIAKRVEREGIYLPSGLGNNKKEFVLVAQKIKELVK